MRLLGSEVAHITRDFDLLIACSFPESQLIAKIDSILCLIGAKDEAHHTDCIRSKRVDPSEVAIFLVQETHVPVTKKQYVSTGESLLTAIATNQRVASQTTHRNFTTQIGLTQNVRTGFAGSPEFRVP